MDLINRQDVIDIIMGDGLYCDTYADKVYSAERIKNIPAVESPKGKWKEVAGDVICPFCGYSCDDPYYLHEGNYCPDCGAKLEWEE